MTPGNDNEGQFFVAPQDGDESQASAPPELPLEPLPIVIDGAEYTPEQLGEALRARQERDNWQAANTQRAQEIAADRAAIRAERDAINQERARIADAWAETLKMQQAPASRPAPAPALVGSMPDLEEDPKGFARAILERDAARAAEVEALKAQIAQVPQSLEQRIGTAEAQRRYDEAVATNNELEARFRRDNARLGPEVVQRVLDTCVAYVKPGEDGKFREEHLQAAMRIAGVPLAAPSIRRPAAPLRPAAVPSRLAAPARAASRAPASFQQLGPSTGAAPSVGKIDVEALLNDPNGIATLKNSNPAVYEQLQHWALDNARAR